MNDTDKCPLCGGDLERRMCVFECLDCGEELSPATLRRIRELEATVAERERACFIEALQAAQAKDRVRELEAENERLKKALEFIEQAADVRGVVTDQYSVIRGVAQEALKK